MLVQKINQSAQSAIVQDTAQVSGRYSTLIPSIASKLCQLAIPIFAVVALSNIPGADAGPIAYSCCIIACTGAGPAAPFCWTMCLAALFSPGP